MKDPVILALTNSFETVLRREAEGSADPSAFLREARERVMILIEDQRQIDVAAGRLGEISIDAVSRAVEQALSDLRKQFDH